MIARLNAAPGSPGNKQTRPGTKARPHSGRLRIKRSNIASTHLLRDVFGLPDGKRHDGQRGVARR